MLRVFSPVDTSFTSNGDKVITPLLAVIHKVDNGDYYLELEASLDDIDYIKPNNIVVAPTPQGDQAFRVDTVETSGRRITAKLWHISYDMENYVIKDTYIVNKNCSDALNQVNNNTDNESPFIVSSDVDTIASFRCVRKSLQEAIFTILDRWGGHLVRDNFNVSIMREIGSDNGVTIQYKKNLKEIEVSYDWSEVCTKVMPVGTDGFLLEEVYLYSDIQYDIPFTKVVSFEQDIDEEDYPDKASYEAALREDLIEKARAYLSVSQYPAVTYTISANMEKITDVGDLVEVYDERLGVSITANVIAFDYDCILGSYKEVVFGTPGSSLGDLLSDIGAQIDTAITESSQSLSVNLQAAIEVAERRIWSELGSSYCVFSGDEILILDKIPLSEAVNVIKIDKSGISISSNGVGGSFSLVWSIDGSFDLSTLDILNLTADLIKGGVYHIGSNNNSLGSIEILSEDNSTIGTIDKDGIKAEAKDGSYIIVSPVEGISVYDRLNNKILSVADGKISYKKSQVEEEVNLFNKAKLLPIEVYESSVLVNDGIGLVIT